MPLLNRGLGAFVEVEGEVFLVALRRESRGLPLMDLSRLAYDLERALYLSAEEVPEAEGWLALAADFLEEALFHYQETDQRILEAMDRFPQVMLALAQEQVLREERLSRERVLRRWQEKAGDGEAPA